MEIESSFICTYCFQVNTILIDGSAGKKQEYVEDCEVCCKPNHLTVTVDENLESAEIYAEAV